MITFVIGKEKNMSTILFGEIVFGPIHSRRLGVSLGINLLPDDGKVCSFDCIYCECGYNADKRSKKGLPTREAVYDALKARLKFMLEKGEKPDVITFAGNGEPTLHPQFEDIIEDTINLRDQYFPEAKVSVLSNANHIGKESVFRALNKVDNNILKLDSVFIETIEAINEPNQPDFSVDKLVDNLKSFNGNLIIQTLFLRGEHKGKKVDNTTDEEINAWLNAIKYINPKQVMIYSIDRETPEKNLEKLSKKELEKIAEKVRQAGLDVLVSA